MPDGNAMASPALTATVTTIPGMLAPTCLGSAGSAFIVTMAVDSSERGHDVLRVASLQLEHRAAVDDAVDDLAHVVDLGALERQQLANPVAVRFEGRVDRPARRCFLVVRRQVRQEAAHGVECLFVGREVTFL